MVETGNAELQRLDTVEVRGKSQLYLFQSLPLQQALHRQELDAGDTREKEEERFAMAYFHYHSMSCVKQHP